MKDGCTSQKIEKQRSIALPVLNNSLNPKDVIAKSRTSRWRAVALIILNLLMIAHIIQWRFSGQTVSPIEPSETMWTLQNGAINAGFIFFTLAILATLIFGRFVCGWGCHIVALQDFCAWLLKKFGLTPKPFRSRLLIFVPLIVALYMFVYPTVIRFFAKPPNEPLIPEFTNHLITSNFWETFPPVLVAIPFLFICGFMTVYFLGRKGFCTYACPYGGVFVLADKVAPGKIRVTDACNQCGHCTATCTANVQVHAEVKEYGMVIDPGCMKHMDCISVCPNDALYFGFGKPAIGVPKKIKKNYLLIWVEEIGSILVFLGSWVAFRNAYPYPLIFAFIAYFVLKALRVLIAKDEKNYSLTRIEEIVAVLVFAGSFFAVWDVYQLVPMLMALGIATITTYLELRIWRLFRVKDLSFYRFQLKSSGTIRKAGWAFLSLGLLWIGVNAHSGWVRYNESAGARAFENIQIPDELALARTNPARWLSAIDLQNIAAGKKHFYAARRVGLFTNKEAISKLAWIEYLSGNTEQALNLLSSAAEHQEGQGKALSLYYRGAILNRLGRYEQALASLDEALAERPDLIVAGEEKGESLWKLGRRQDAIAAWRDAVKANPNLPLANNMLAGAAASQGQTEAAAAYEKQADQSTPNDPLFHWMVGLRLQNVGMDALAEKHFARAIEINPDFKKARTLDSRIR